MNNTTRILSTMAVTMTICGSVGALICFIMAIGTAIALPGLGMIISGPIFAGLAGLGFGVFVGAVLGLFIGIIVGTNQNPK